MEKARRHWLAALFVMLLLVIVILSAHIASNTYDQTCTVTDKYRVTDHGNDQQIVLTTTCGTLRVADSPFDWSVDSMALFDSIEIGQTYVFTIREPILFTESYPNIIRIRK